MPVAAKDAGSRSRDKASAVARRERRTNAAVQDGRIVLQDGMPRIEPPKVPTAEGVPPTARLTIGAMVETNGGSSLEDVPGYDSYVARNRGLFQPSPVPLKRPVGHDFVPENMIGPDDREPVGDTTRLPWRAIAMLSIIYQNGAKAVGTAWFLSARTLATAGHNIFHPVHREARSILITPAFDGFTAPYGSHYAAAAYCDPAWSSGPFEDRSLDWGILQMPNRDVGNRTGWFGFAAYSSDDLSRLLVNVSGYPEERSPRTQYFNGGRLAGGTAEFLHYDFDTSFGMSGSPIFARFGDKRVAVGIHTYGSDRGNRARRIDDVLYDRLLSFA